jgi:hypothetical protein
LGWLFGADSTIRHGQESSDTARVWDVYQKRAIENDNDLLEGSNETFNFLLVFVREHTWNVNAELTLKQAALFSAIQTAFLIES